LNVFSLDRDDDVAKTIFKAISSGMYFTEIKLIICLLVQNKRLKKKKNRIKENNSMKIKTD
jgi:hypothetical protein